MGMDFGSAPTQQGGSDGDLIPAGTLAWATVHLRPHNIDQGMVVVPSKKDPNNGYLDLELTIDDGPHARRKIWDMVGIRGSEQYVQGGMAAIRHMLESGRGASPGNRQAYVIGQQYPEGSELGYMDLEGLRVAIKITVEKSKDPQYQDKNRARYLSPNPESDTAKDFARLAAGDTAPKVRAAAPAPGAAPAQMPWSQPAAAPAVVVNNSPPAQPAVAQPAAAPVAAPGWGTSPQPAAAQPQMPPPTGRPAWLPQPTARA